MHGALPDGSWPLAPPETHSRLAVRCAQIEQDDDQVVINYPGEDEEPVELWCQNEADAQGWAQSLEKNIKYLLKKSKSKDAGEDDDSMLDTPRSVDSVDVVTPLAAAAESPKMKKKMKKAGGLKGKTGAGGVKRERRKSAAHEMYGEGPSRLRGVFVALCSSPEMCVCGQSKSLRWRSQRRRRRRTRWKRSYC